MKSYDVIWIGTGQATATVVPRLTANGKTVALIEGGRFGGSCVNYGCTPTKTLVASARAAHMARRSADFGVKLGPGSDKTTVGVDFDVVRERMNGIRNGSSEGLEGWLRGLDNVTVYDGYGKFETDHQVRIGDDVIEGETIVIHTGTRTRTIGIPGLDDVDWVDNAGLLELEEIPEHLMIVGGSYIGMEFAQVFRRFGSEVTLFEAAPQLMTREDADVAEIAQEILENEGIAVHTGVEISQLNQHGPQQIEVNYRPEGGPEQLSVEGTHLLMAVGRLPNSDSLNLEAAGVSTCERGYIQVDDHLKTNVPHIFAIGDVNGNGAFTHTSVNDGEIFWDVYSGEDNRTVSMRNTIYAMFIDPPLGRIGMSEKEARESGRNVLMATKPMADVSRAKEKDETAGLIKLLVDADSEEFLGATVFGVGGDEIINIFSPIMLTGGSYKLFRKAVLTHPTVAELLPWTLDGLEPLKGSA